MADNQKLSVKSMILYGLAIIVVAFIGVVAGNWFVKWRHNDQIEMTTENWELNNRSALNRGDLFPDELLINMDGDSVNASSVIGGRKNLILFVATGCEACGMAIESWKKEVEDLPADLLVWGIGVGGLDELRAYKEQTGFPFPIYCDLELMYAQQYDLGTFPSVIGLDADGKVALIMQGYSQKYDLKDYYDYITKAEQQPETEAGSEGL